MVDLAQNWTTVGLQHQCVNTMLEEPRLEGRLGAVSVCVFTSSRVSFSFITSTRCSVVPPSLIDVTAFCSEPRRLLKFVAQCFCLCPFFCSHTTLSTLPSTCQTCREIGNKLVFSKSVDACWGRPEYVSSLEHVQARLTLSHNQRGKLAIHLISPLGTRSTLLFPRYTVKHHTNSRAPI